MTAHEDPGVESDQGRSAPESDPTPSDLILDEAASLAADVCHVPCAWIRLVGGRARFHSTAEFSGATDSEALRSLLRQTIRGDTLIEIPDALDDPAFAAVVVGDGARTLRFMAATPILVPGKSTIGALCVADRVPRRLDAAQRSALLGVSRMVAAALLERDRHAETGRQLTSDALEQAEQRVRALYEATPAMLHSIDPGGRIVAVSNAWLTALGYSRDEVLGRPSVDFLTPESRQRAREVVLPAFFASGACSDIPYQMLRKDGSVIDVLVSAVLERSPDGQPLRSLAVVQDVTERVLTAERLQDSSHLLQLILDNLPVRISYWDAQNRNRFGNRAFLQSFGVTQAAISGVHAKEVLGADWYERIRAQIERGLAGHAGQVEVSSLAAGGSRRDVEMHFTPDVRDGHVHGLFVLALDVTARREAERRLVDRERRFKLLIDGVRDYAIYMLDADGRIATWNAGAERTMGFRATDVIGRHFQILFTPEDVAAEQPGHELAQAAIAGRFEAEGWRRRSDGRRFWASILLSAIHDDRGHLIGFAKVTRDLSEQQRQQQMLDRTVELAPCAMLMVDAAGKILMVNAQAESTFGYARSDLVGQPLEKLIPDRWRADHSRLREGFQSQPSMRTMGAGRELRALRGNGEEFPVEIGLSPIEWAEGTATLAAVTDITERRRQRALVEQALAEKETLLKEVYHRVKNNLQVVQSLLSLQRRVLVDPQARRALEDSSRRVRAMALVHEKLYQAGNLGSVPLREYSADLLRQIDESTGASRRGVQLQAEVMSVTSKPDSAIPYGLILTELVSNAMEHAFIGRAAGCVRIELAPRADGTPVLSVTDDGVGLPAGFDPASSPSMGLQLAASLAQQLGGRLEATSASGASFFASMPRL